MNVEILRYLKVWMGLELLRIIWCGLECSDGFIEVRVSWEYIYGFA